MAAPVIVSVNIPAPRSLVWADVSVLERHVEWMADAHRIDFIGDSRSGPGTRMKVETRFGPLRTNDVMDVTAWEPETRIGVTHRGLFTGMGEFTLADTDDGTVFTWTEQIHFPWFFGGSIGAWLARPIFRWVWRRNLRALRNRFSDR